MAHLNYTIGGNSNLVSFKSAARVPIDSLKVRFKPIQEGTGDQSPENVRPITGWTGVEAYKTGINLIDEAFLSDPNNYVNVGAYGYYYTEDVRLSPNTKYRFVWSDYDDSKINSCNLYVSGANEYIISDGAYRQYPEGFTTNNSGIIRFGINHRGGYNNITEALSDIFKYGKLLLQVGTTATSYEPYTGQTIPVEFHGKNLFDYVSADFEYGIRDNNGVNVSDSNSGYTRTPTPVQPSTTYTLSGNALTAGGYVARIYYLDAAKGWISRTGGDQGNTITFTTPSNCAYIQIQTKVYGTNPETWQLELGSTATAYEPYNNTFYGGYVDIAKGELVETVHGYTFTGAETVTNFSTSLNAAMYAAPNLDGAVWASGYDGVAQFCNYAVVTGRTNIANYSNALVVGDTVGGNQGVLFLKIDGVTSANDMKAWLKEKYDGGNPLVALYKLATPITYQLTPAELKTLLSTNNIWSNANDATEVSYAVHDSAMIRAAKRRMAMAVSNPDFLPSSYRRLTGIIFDTKTYYLFNNFHLQGNDTVRISVSVNKSCNVFGCYSSGSAQDNYSLYATTSNTGKYLRYNGETYKSRWASTDQGQRYDIIITPTGSSGMPPSQNDTWEEKNFVSETELCVGTTAVSASSSKLDGIIYGNFIVDNRLCAVPVERISDGTVGYYEMYTNTFYKPIGTNPEKLGYA